MRPKDPNNRRRKMVLRAFRHDPNASLGKLMSMTGLSRTAVYYHLCSLQKDGVITRSDKRRGPRGENADNKKSLAGKDGRGNNAFEAKKAKTADSLQERIDLVVRMAAQKSGGENYHDVLDHRVRLSGAVKVG